MNVEHGRLTHSQGYVFDYRITVPDVVRSPYLHVLFHGFSRIESHVPPVFARKQWSGWTDSVCLFLSDPIHNVTQNSACGWFLLGEDEFLPRVLDLRTTLTGMWGLTGTVWHGLSSGGYAALKHCVLGGEDDLAFVIAPHNDPTVLPQWERELVPFAGLPAMGTPVVMTDLLQDWGTERRSRFLYVLVSERDSYFALEHLRPILAGLGGHPSAHAVMLRDGRGHGFIADTDYESRLADAVQRWEAYRESAPHNDTEVQKWTTTSK